MREDRPEELFENEKHLFKLKLEDKILLEGIIRQAEAYKNKTIDPKELFEVFLYSIEDLSPYFDQHLKQELLFKVKTFKNSSLDQNKSIKNFIDNLIDEIKSILNHP